ncbi:hypothetical protein GJ744_001452 [Endocarpon pusillum]|uniref:Uncharacterized protein n=1 Tax=Endocarpon pusillum TaxID=364733 RepID=A0A8H7E7W3_9EURO|nr:hypothetical protein GJ744_001452 [Endocarpon pusillum]
MLSILFPRSHCQSRARSLSPASRPALLSSYDTSNAAQHEERLQMGITRLTLRILGASSSPPKTSWTRQLNVDRV